MMALAFGMMMGPVISTIVFPYFHYAGTFYFFAAFILVGGLLPLIFVPSRLNKFEKEEEGDVKITFGIFIKNRFVIITIIVLIGSMVCTNWTIPTLSDEMVDNHSPPMSTSTAGLSFALMALFAGGGSPLLGKLCKIIPRKWVCLFGLLFQASFILLVGPS
jgi:predicted MFS family arabinose efflux permease